MNSPQSEAAAANDLDVLRQRVTAFCAERGYRLSPQADDVMRDIVRSKEANGDYYCPCQVQPLPETVCVCQAVRNGLVAMMGGCYCNLILDKAEGGE